MEMIWHELTLGLGSGRQAAQVLLRLCVAALIGGFVGFQRERARKPAGLRTHILVCTGTSLVVLVCSATGMTLDGQSRVIQGVVTGIGFIGAGSILKLSHEQHIKGLTTAAGLWVTAAIGVACGVGAVGIALIAAALTLGVLALASRLEHHYPDDQF